ncbi:hypothetical protein Patl1_00859 [Pistacia atlantica]|uniref:Uncharacterized protein n=1 Tax=Pistacia atlantica TaxID=434234 RepID=A0ACC1CD21_9ROSI|nr:hypothetical protein Patl1_00859 [Pistacia atlantica]
MASTPPHCSITATKPYQNHPYPQNQLKNNHHRQTHHQNPQPHWTTHKVSLTKPPLSPSPRNAPKPAATSTTTTQNPKPFHSLAPLPSSKSELAPNFSGRRSTRFVSKMHFGRPKINMSTRHTSVAEEALQHAIHYAKDDKSLDSVLLNFETKLCGSDDYTFLLRELGNRGEWSKAIHCFDFAIKRERKKNEQGKLASAMISILGRLGKVDLAKNIFETALNEGYGNTVYAFSALISAYGRSGYCDEAIRVFDSMKKFNLKPNLVTYNAVIDACGKGGVEFKRVLEIFDDMLKNGVQPDRITFNSLLAVCSRGGLWEAARNLFSEMVNRGIDQDIFTYNTEMESSGIRKDVVTFNALLGGYGKQWKYDEVRRVFAEMKAARVSPNLLTYSTLIDVYSKGGFYKEAMELFREFKQAGLKADVVLYSALIDALCKNGLVESAVSLLDEMTKEGIRPNVVTYNCIIDAFGRSAIAESPVEDGDRDIELKKESSNLNKVLTMDDKEGQLVGRADNQIIQFFGQLAAEKAGQAKKENRCRQEILCILSVFQKMHELQIKPNVVTFSAILNACSRCNSFEDASMLLEELRLFDNQVYGVAHGLLMGCRENVWVQALSLFDEVKQMDSSTASAFYNALTDMLWHFGQKRGAQLVVLEGKRRQVWENVWSDSCLDLHLMSSGAARAMVHAWLLNIRAVVFEGHELPKLLSILTGWGKHSKVVGDGAVRRAIEGLLTGMGAPFWVARCNLGRFISTGPMVAAWLRESGTMKVLVLHDDRTHSENSRFDKIPDLQTLPL